MFDEIPVTFACHGQRLIGMVHKPAPLASAGVLIIVGGPQCRVGSHRQFVLLARELAAHGFACMRFDYRGMGDSEGEMRDFAGIDDDIRAALDCFQGQCPGLENIILWGLCDAASAALFYGYQDARVRGLVLLNPWVYTEQGAARTWLRHYYWRRLVSRDLWRKLLTRNFDFRAFWASLAGLLRKAQILRSQTVAIFHDARPVADLSPLPVRMRECLRRFSHPVLVILSGLDLTADEFRDTVNNDAGWRELIDQPRVSLVTLKDANHTFSSAGHRNQVAQATLSWLADFRT